MKESIIVSPKNEKEKQEILEYLKNRKAKTEKISQKALAKARKIDELKQAFAEVKQMRDGKIDEPTIEYLIDELNAQKTKKAKPREAKKGRAPKTGRKNN